MAEDSSMLDSSMMPDTSVSEDGSTDATTDSGTEDAGTEDGSTADSALDGGPVCGDGTIGGDEMCDDEGTSDGDGCSSSCLVEPGYECVEEPSTCGAICGDGEAIEGEVCDDGNTTNETECPYGTPSCTLCDATCETALELTGRYCDDDELDPEEECETNAFHCVGCDIKPLIVVTRDFWGGASSSSLSSEGRFVLFNRLGRYDPRDLSNGDDVYLKDLATNDVFFLSFAWDGMSVVDGASFAGGISDDGEIAVFGSQASNLHMDDDDGGINGRDVFIYHRTTGEVELIPTPMGWLIDPVVSGDGRFVGFTSYDPSISTVALNQIVVRDLTTGENEVVSMSSVNIIGDRGAARPSINGDGNFIAFETSARNLVAGDANNLTDVFVRDRDRSRTTRVSVSSMGAEADGSSERASISRNGRYVAFLSSATNLVESDTNGAPDIFVHDRMSSETFRVSVRADGSESIGASVGMGAVSDTGSVVFSTSDALISEDTNGTLDIYAFSIETGDIQLVSLDENGAPPPSGTSISPSINAAGTVVTFQSDAPLMAGVTGAHIFRREL